MADVLPNHFDRAKPFYPLIMLYSAQLAGFKELALLGIPGVQRSFEFSESTAGSFNEGTEAERTLAKLLGPLQLRSEWSDTTVDIPIDFLARELAAEHWYLAAWLAKSAGYLLIVAHELIREEPWYDRSPSLEFLRHCRNAAAHGGQFHLSAGEPRRPAKWGQFEICEQLAGENLIKDKNKRGLLSPGDPIRLLWDIEQRYPEMRADPASVGFE